MTPAEKIDALSQRYRDGEFSADIYRASLVGLLPPDEADIMVRNDTAIRTQFAGSNVRPLPRQTADHIATVIKTMRTNT